MVEVRDAVILNCLWIHRHLCYFRRPGYLTSALSPLVGSTISSYLSDYHVINILQQEHRRIGPFAFTPTAKESTSTRKFMPLRPRWFSLKLMKLATLKWVLEKLHEKAIDYFNSLRATLLNFVEKSSYLDLRGAKGTPATNQSPVGFFIGANQRSTIHGGSCSRKGLLVLLKPLISWKNSMVTITLFERAIDISFEDRRDSEKRLLEIDDPVNEP